MKPRSSSRRGATAGFSFFLLLWIAQGLRAGLGNDNPNGPAGDYNGSITTAGYYDPFSGNAKRAIDDITVPGSVGAYPLKWTRYLNTRGTVASFFGQGGGWTHSYNWGLGIWAPPPPPIEPGPEGRIGYPDGRTVDLGLAGGGYYRPMRRALDQVLEEVQKTGGGNYGAGYYDLLLADGGKVQFRPVTNVGLAPVAIVDPYGLTTTLTWNNAGRLVRVTEPGGRYLEISYETHTWTENGYNHTAHLINHVEAFDGRGNLIERVDYNYTQGEVATYVGPQRVYDLTGVDYDDGTHATYTYEPANVTESYYAVPWHIVSTCDDVRYNGPMRKIKYEYVGPNQVAGGASWGQISAEKNKATDEIVSQVTYPLPGQPENSPGYYKRWETRGDGQTRVFHYGDSLEYPTPFPELSRYSDFQGHNTNISYSLLGGGAVRKSVTNARGYTTQIDRNATGLITKITYPGANNPYVEYTYSNIYIYYLETSRNEGGKVTTHTRDPNRHWITRTDYPADANTPASFETFTYNPFGQVTTHRLKNGKYQHFQYDTRGLLTAKWNPTTNSTPVGGDPQTTYTYYTAADGKPGWIDRLKTETMPENVSGYPASETYEYDRALTNGGVTNPTGPPVPGRGLITKKIHADGRYQSFGYNRYGDKMWEENELRKRTSYQYDEYRRQIAVTDPYQKTTYYSYELTNGNQNLSPTLHTTASVRFVTTPTGVRTENRYDENFRKISTKVGTGTPASTTWFHYDAVGNQDYVTDGRGTGSGDANYTTYSDYDERNRKWRLREPLNHTTVFHYDPASNITSIDRPDQTTEYKEYDALNRLITHKVPKENPANNNTVEDSITRFEYYPSGAIWEVTNPNNKITTFGYDASDRKIWMIYPDTGQYQGWTYDDAGNLASRRTVGGKMQNFTYDSRNRRKTMTWDNHAEWAYYIYDLVGRLHQAYNGTGSWNTNIISTVTREYDDAGRLTLDRQALTGIGTRDVNYDYDDDGKQTRLWVTSSNYDYTFTYDTLGRFEKIAPTSNPGSIYFQYYYDKAFNETERRNVWTATRQIYTRDNLNRVSRLDIKRGAYVIGSEIYGYDAMSRVTTITREDDTSDVLTYYKDGELWTAQYGVTGIQAPGIEPPPDEAPPDPAELPPDPIEPPPPGEELPPPETQSAESPDEFERESEPPSGEPMLAPNEGDLIPAGAAISVEVPWPLQGPDAPASTRDVTYKLDKMGNRTSVVDGTTRTYAPNAFNQYTSAEGLSVTNGNEHQITGYDSVVYTYRNDEQLISVTGPATYDLAYDALGRCVKRTLNSDTTFYIYDGEKPIIEIPSTGGLAGWNIYGKGIDEIAERGAYGADNAWHWLFCQQDGNGNVTHLTIATAAVEKYRYDAFGKPTFYNRWGDAISGTAFSNRFLFTGREYAPRFSIYEYRARAYNPKLGRFMSEDPKGFDAGDYNLFRYVHNDPLDLTDPMGLEDLTMFPAGERHRVYDSGPQVYDIGAHGLSGTIFDEHSRAMTAKQLLNRIKQDPAYSKAKEIKLWACDAAKGKNPIADQLAKASGKPTSGPNDVFWEKGKKGLVAPIDKKNPDQPAKNERGQWIKYIPAQSNQNTNNPGASRNKDSSNTEPGSDPKRSTSDILDAAQIDNQQGEVPDFSMLGGGPLGLGGPPRSSRP